MDLAVIACSSLAANSTYMSVLSVKVVLVDYFSSYRNVINNYQCCKQLYVSWICGQFVNDKIQTTQALHQHRDEDVTDLPAINADWTAEEHGW